VAHRSRDKLGLAAHRSRFVDNVASVSLIVAVKGVAKPVAFLKALSQFGVLLCTEHRTGYTIGNYRRHITSEQGLKGRLCKEFTHQID